jgi:hypothetical protein
VSCDASDGRKTEVGETGSSVPVDKDVCLRGRMRYERGDISFEKNSYPFQISVNHAETVHMRQTVRNVNQLNGTSVRLCGNGDRGATHKLDTVHTFVPSNKLDDVTMFHPLGDHRKPVFAYRHSEEW